MRASLLDRDDIGEGDLRVLSPEMGPIRGVDELRTDAHAISGFAHGAFDQMRRTKCSANRAQIPTLTFKSKCRSTPNHDEARHLSERCRHLLCHAIGEELLFHIT